MERQKPLKIPEKHYPAITVTIAVLLIAFSFKNQPAIDDKHKVEMTTDTIFLKGSVISNNNFTGTAWLSWLVQTDSIYNYGATAQSVLTHLVTTCFG